MYCPFPSILGKLPIEKTDIKQFIKGLKEHTLYKVHVAYKENNPVHLAFLFSGFEGGSNSYVYTNTYEMPSNLRECYFIEIVKELSSLE